MMTFLAILYGVSMVGLIYWISYLSVRSLFKARVIPFFVVIGKYLIYWQAISLGFKYLPEKAIMVGFVVGIYSSFPVLYWINKKIKI